MKITMQKVVMLLLNIFRKEISDFISSSTTSGVNVDGLTNAAYGDLIMAARSCVQEWVDAGRPDTGFPGEWGSNHCVSQQALWAQPWMNDNHHAMWVALANAQEALIQVTVSHMVSVTMMDGGDVSLDI